MSEPTALYREYKTESEADFLHCELEERGWNVTATAHALGIPLSTLKYRIKTLKLKRPSHAKAEAQS